MDLEFMGQSFVQLLAGVPLTIELVAIAMVIAIIAAVILAIMRDSGIPVFDYPARFYIFLFRSIPLLVLLYLIYYGVAQVLWIRESVAWHIFRSPFSCALVAFSINSAAYFAEILRGAMKGVPVGQREAAKAFGMSPALIYRRIIFPLAFKVALPGLSNELILLVKGTSLASVITLMEVTGIAYRLISVNYRSLEVFASAGIIYLMINYSLTWAIQRLDRRLQQ